MTPRLWRSAKRARRSKPRPSGQERVGLKLDVGILGPPDDPQVLSVAGCLSELGAKPVIVDLSSFPVRPLIAWEDRCPRIEGLDLGTIVSWYLRSAPLALPFFPVENKTAALEDVEGLIADTRKTYAAGRERRSFVAGLLSALEERSRRFVNPQATMAQHFRKLDQLAMLQRGGVPVPRTLATNDGDQVVRFFNELDGKVIYKPLAGGGLARRLLVQDLRPERLALLAVAPVMFQEEVQGRNIRVYVVDGAVVAAYEIVSDALDYRGSETEVRPAVLNEQMKRSSIAAASSCEMPFTGIDIRERQDGTFSVLECNPSPMFASIETAGEDRPISSALAAALTG